MMQTLFTVSPDTIFTRRQATISFGDTKCVFLYDKYGKPTCYISYETFSGFRRGSRVGILLNVVKVYNGTQETMNDLYRRICNITQNTCRYDLALRTRYYSDEIPVDNIVRFLEEETR